MLKGASNMTWKERKRVENRNVVALGGKVLLEMSFLSCSCWLVLCNVYLSITDLNSLLRSIEHH